MIYVQTAALVIVTAVSILAGVALGGWITWRCLRPAERWRLPEPVEVPVEAADEPRSDLDDDYDGMAEKFDDVLGEGEI